VRKYAVAFALVGLGLATVLVAWFGAGRVLDAALAVGWRGFALLLTWQLLLFGLLGLAWTAIMPPEQRRWKLLIWGRMVRDASTTCLPFSPIGGFVFGARAVTMQGLGWPLAAASTIVDVSLEVVAQLAFTVVGLAILLTRDPGSALLLPIVIGLAVIGILMGIFIALQRDSERALAWLGERIAGDRMAADDGTGTAKPISQRLGVMQAELALIHGHPGRLLRGFLTHFCGWLATGVAGWINFNLLGVPISLVSALAIEALLHAAITATFVVPGAAGVQEAAYTGLGALFGAPPEIALAVSLVRRARDITLGVPILLVWQTLEARRLRQIGRA